MKIIIYYIKNQNEDSQIIGGVNTLPEERKKEKKNLTMFAFNLMRPMR